MPKDKTDNFLQAIKKYAKSQKNAMQGEVKQIKTERLKEAEEKAKRDSRRLIKETLADSRKRQTAALAKLTQEGQKRLFIERSRMVDEVFSLAAQKLHAFTQTDAYLTELRENARDIAALFDGRDCVLWLMERDLDKAEELKGFFGGSTQIRTDPAIRIGGVRGYCESMGIMADLTLDSRLEAQREWFIENAALRVL